MNNVNHFLNVLNQINYDNNIIQDLDFNKIEEKEELRELKEFRELSDEEKIKHYFKNFNEQEILYFKNSVFKERIEECDLEKIVIRIHKKSGFLKKPIKIVGVDDGLIYVKSISGRGKTYYFYDSNYYCFIKKNMSFRDYLEEFVK